MVESWSRSEEIQQSQDHDTLEFGGGSLGTVGFGFPNGNGDTQLELDDDTQLDLDTDHCFASRLGPEAGTQDLDQEDEAEYTSKSMGFDVRLRGGEGGVTSISLDIFQCQFLNASYNVSEYFGIPPNGIRMYTTVFVFL